MELYDEPKHAVLDVSLAGLVFPQCCAVCHGPGDGTLLVSFPLKRSQLKISFNLPVCEANQQKVTKVLTVNHYFKSTSEATLHVPDKAWAALIARCNG